MLTETDSKTMAYVNMFAVLGTLENLCDLVPQAKELLAGQKPVSIGFSVKDGPSATFHFENSGCVMETGCDKCDIKLPFSSCKKFNGLLKGTTNPFPSKGFTKINFLLKVFVPLTTLLSKYLQPSKEDLVNEEFRRVSTMLTLYAAAASISQVGNVDMSGKYSAHLIPDGDIAMEVIGSIGITIHVKNHFMTLSKQHCSKPRAVMSFSSLNTVGQLLSGEVSAMGCICSGSIAMSGMINMIDNLNRILDRVGQYLAV